MKREDAEIGMKVVVGKHKGIISSIFLKYALVDFGKGIRAWYDWNKIQVVKKL